ncbi:MULTISPECIES: hypothetical protein [Pseudomonas]|jgi:hypothetical protein|uniref:hypothetical protein n=1 Tax=Pseudomonas TaxID=286 RepID=UPI002AB3A234|nr:MULTISPECIES: hypothetical protein [unclassified Pseudomonas]MDY7584933.1 hypothetical protein [Pseudomonas sp. CCI3.1]MEB0066348.1 hypothetical protein [Pseudomonas sp. CCI3.1]MEB0071666.1 hypothetical protein [Pseudomonas sp. CCI1.4]
MHPSFAQRVTALEGLRARARQATAEFYQKPGVQPPPLAPLIIVRPSGNNTFSLINRTTGVVVAERFGHNNATAHARELEAKAAQFSIKQFGKALRNWALRIGAMLAVFVFFGRRQ